MISVQTYTHTHLTPFLEQCRGRVSKLSKLFHYQLHSFSFLLLCTSQDSDIDIETSKVISPQHSSRKLSIDCLTSQLSYLCPFVIITVTPVTSFDCPNSPKSKGLLQSTTTTTRVLDKGCKYIDNSCFPFNVFTLYPQSHNVCVRVLVLQLLAHTHTPHMTCNQKTGSWSFSCDRNGVINIVCLVLLLTQFSTTISRTLRKREV